jgi:hypothetical protein
MSGRQKQVKELIHAAKDQGWDVEVDGSGHFRLTPPGDDQIAISISSTPSDYRTLKNEAAKLKRMGLQLPGQPKQEAERLCLASWHSEAETAIGFCGHCRGTWKVTEDDDITAFLSEPDKQEFVIPEEWTQPRLTLRDEIDVEDEEVSVDVDEGSIRSRVLKAMQDLHGEFLSTDEVATITDLPKASAGAALRQLYAKGDLQRSKRGRYGIHRPKTEPEPEPQPETEVVVDLTPETEPEPEITVTQKQPQRVVVPMEHPVPDPTPVPEPTPSTAVAGGPPDPSKAWRWVPDTGWVEDTTRAPDVALYEGTGLKDKQQRPIIKDENGDLFVAIPLVMGI